MAIITRAGKGSALTHAEMDANLGYLVPAGAVMAFAMNTAPAGWIKCDGTAVSRTTYADLFAAIGTTFGAGDGSTTFNLPDLRGEFVRGWDNSRGVDSGRAFGSAQTQNTQNHKHQLPIGFDGSNIYGWMDVSDFPYAGSTTTIGNRARVGSSKEVGQPIRVGFSDTMRDQTGETRPRNVAMMYCIKV